VGKDLAPAPSTRLSIRRDGSFVKVNCAGFRKGCSSPTRRHEKGDSRRASAQTRAS